MIILFHIVLFLKEFLAYNGCFVLFTKIKKKCWTSFSCTFSAWFFHKNVLYLILFQRTKFQCHNLFPSLNTKQDVLLSSYLDSWDVTNFKIYLRTTSKAMAGREKKGGRRKYKNLNILRTKRASLFHSFWRAIIWWKIKIRWKIADTSFKNENILNKELYKPIFRKFNIRKVHSPFTDNIWSADLVGMQLISIFNKGFRFFLCVIDIYSKYAWITLKDKKGTTITNAFQKNFLKNLPQIKQNMGWKRQQIL